MQDNVWILLEIVLVNVVLSGDNAIVIAMASRNLPDRLARRAVWIGAIGAVALRILLAAIAVTLLDYPGVRIVGALLLLYIAIHLLLDDGEAKKIGGGTSLGAAVGVILLSDLVMSLDNVLAIAAIAGNDLRLMAAGIALGIPLIVWGSRLMMKALTRIPSILWVGSAILGYASGEMLADVAAVQSLLPNAGWFPFASAMFVLTAAYAWRRTSGGLSGKAAKD